jgi:hypothetical protein
MTISNTINRETYCLHCGAGIAAGARFCQGCGKAAAAQAQEQPVRAVLTRVTGWDLFLIALGLWWSYTLVVAARNLAGYRYEDAAYLLGRHFSILLFAAAIAYGIAGRKQIRNWHRFCRVAALSLFILPLLPFISAIGKSV